MSAALLEAGTVKCWFADKGFGFVRSDNPALDDVFVHATVLRDAGISALERGDRVRFVRITDRRGFRAVQVEML